MMPFVNAHVLAVAHAAEADATFELFPLRLRFRALAPLYFPPGKAGNVIRGALGRIFRLLVCAPHCPGTKTCERKASCAYARLFEPAALVGGPSGLGDWPRPFVIRASHLDGRRVRPEETFHFDLSIFEMKNPAVPYFAFSFLQLIHEGLGPGRGAAELKSIHALDAAGETKEQLFDGEKIADPHPLAVSLMPGEPAYQIIVRFLTPTELKGGGELVREPHFGILFARIRDRVNTLRQIYGQGSLAIDFAAMGERARQVKLLRSDLRWESSERRSGKTGQRHPLSGFVGWAEYEGELTEFLPYLRAACWTGVGRQTSWGKGQIEVSVIA